MHYTYYECMDCDEEFNVICYYNEKNFEETGETFDGLCPNCGSFNIEEIPKE